MKAATGSRCASLKHQKKNHYKFSVTYSTIDIFIAKAIYIYSKYYRSPIAVRYFV